MPSSIESGAVYGIGIYGTSQYGVASVTVLPDGVSATAFLNDTLEISADALHAIASPNEDPLDSFVGDVSVVGKAIVLLTGVDATVSLGTLNILATSFVFPTGLSATVSLGTITLETNNYLSITGVASFLVLPSVDVSASSFFILSASASSTGSIGSVLVLENEVQIPSSLSATLQLGTVAVTVNVFNFNTTASQYSRYRTAYVPRRTTAKDRTVIIPAGQ